MANPRLLRDHMASSGPPMTAPGDFGAIRSALRRLSGDKDSGSAMLGDADVGAPLASCRQSTAQLMRLCDVVCVWEQQLYVLQYSKTFRGDAAGQGETAS